MPKEWNVCSLTILLLVTILVTTISSYFKISNIENYLTTPTATDTSNVIDLYQSETVKELRKKALISAENDRRVLYNASLKTNGQDFYRKVKMEAYCGQKERIGEKGDGGKYVCNPKKVKKDCTLMSLGLNNQIGYDKHIFEVTGGQCRILGADVIFIEIHGTPAEHLKMLQTIAKYGFRIFNVDENPYCTFCCEYSMINELCMAQFEVVPLGITIPQAND